MNFTEAVKTCFNKYATFTGRAIRSEYWYFTLFLFLGGIVTGIVGLDSVFSLATLIPSIAVTVRRLHDTDHSGWWVLLVFIPVIGWIILLVWTVTRGTSGPNRFGHDHFDGHAPATPELEISHTSSIPRVSRNDD